MSTLFQAVNTTAATQNGAKAFHTSTNANVDFFYLAGASRGKNIDVKFLAALVENEDQALRILQWLRDVRQGSGERQLFRNLFKVAVDLHQFNETIISKSLLIVNKLPELGRFDDLLWVYENVQQSSVREQALNVFINALKDGNGLAYKWTPVKGDTAKVLRKMMGFHNEKSWRKHVVPSRSTVEQKMCAKEWNDIDFGKLPSVASARYQKAFGRNAPEKYSSYITSLTKGEAKINAGAVYPYDVVKSVKYGNNAVADQQWKALPNYLDGNDKRILPLIDVSGSMTCPAGGNHNLMCMDVAVSLGLYLSERIAGPFKDMFITFDDNPRMLQAKGTLTQRAGQVYSSPWGGSTNLERVFTLVLNAAVINKVPAEEMPEVIVIFSDMQFNTAFNDSGRSTTLFNKIDELYTKAGYTRPQIVFWNLNADNTTTPVTAGEAGTTLVSGFSPSLMKSIFKNENPNTTPYEQMLSVIMDARYDLE
jgi:hypothetical protein